MIRDGSTTHDDRSENANTAVEQTQAGGLDDAEQRRLKALESYSIMDSERDARYEALVQEIARECDVPIATITFLDADRQWFKAAIGLEVTETPRNVSVCTHTIMEPGHPLVIPNITLDERFVANPLVVGDFGLMAYAGVPIVTADGSVLGTVCAMDHKPRDYQPDDIVVLERISQKVLELLETSRTADELTSADEEKKPAFTTGDLHRFAAPAVFVDAPDAAVTDVSFSLTRPLIEAIGEDLDVVRLVESFAESVLETFGWWAACVFWMQGDRLKPAPWRVAATAPTGLSTLSDQRVEPIVVDTLQVEYHDATLLDLGMTQWLSDRDVLNALGARNLVVIDIAGAAALAARIVFLVPSSRALSLTASRTLTIAAAVLPRVILQQRARQELTYRATHDALTGLYNREGLKHVFSPTRTAGQFNRAVLYLDIDNFKRINDGYGHRVGDELLSWVARTLNAQLRPTDTVFRIGGDEFLIVLDGIDGDEDVEKVAERLLQRLVRPVPLLRNTTVPVSVSIGAARWDTGPLDDVTGKADRLMYSAKELGGGQAACARDGGPVVFGPRTQTPTELESALTEAIGVDVSTITQLVDDVPVGVQFSLRASLRHPAFELMLDAIEQACLLKLTAAQQHRERPLLQCVFDRNLWAIDGMIVRLCVALRERFPTAQITLICDPRGLEQVAETVAAVRRGVGLNIAFTRFGAGGDELALLDTVNPDIIELDPVVVETLSQNFAPGMPLPGVLIAAHALVETNGLQLQAAVNATQQITADARNALHTAGVGALIHGSTNTPKGST